MNRGLKSFECFHLRNVKKVGFFSSKKLMNENLIGQQKCTEDVVALLLRSLFRLPKFLSTSCFRFLASCSLYMYDSGNRSNILACVVKQGRQPILAPCSNVIPWQLRVLEDQKTTTTWQGRILPLVCQLSTLQRDNMRTIRSLLKMSFFYLCWS